MSHQLGVREFKGLNLKHLEHEIGGLQEVIVNTLFRASMVLFYKGMTLKLKIMIFGGLKWKN